MVKGASLGRKWAENMAVEALGFIAADADRLGRFLAVTGIDPAGVRQAAREPAFLAGILDYVCSDESLLLAIAAESGSSPQDVERARGLLGDRRWERDVP